MDLARHLNKQLISEFVNETYNEKITYFGLVDKEELFVSTRKKNLKLNSPEDSSFFSFGNNLNEEQSFVVLHMNQSGKTTDISSTFNDWFQEKMKSQQPQ